MRNNTQLGNITGEVTFKSVSDPWRTSYAREQDKQVIHLRKLLAAITKVNQNILYVRDVSITVSARTKAGCEFVTKMVEFGIDEFKRISNEQKYYYSSGSYILHALSKLNDTIEVACKEVLNSIKDSRSGEFGAFSTESFKTQARGLHEAHIKNEFESYVKGQVAVERLAEAERKRVKDEKNHEFWKNFILLGVVAAIIATVIGGLIVDKLTHHEASSSAPSPAVTSLPSAPSSSSNGPLY